MKELEKAVQLKAELDNLRPLSKENESRIMQKFRLDWNYHSNNIEGNSLTYGETKALILFHITAKGKPLKDHLEIEGHNEAVNWILSIVKDERPITENFIRELHKLILKRPYEIPTKSPEGLPTKKMVKIGEYKTTPNHVETVTGEIFRFATPEETPAEMTELVDWYRKETERKDVNPILLAARFHYKFIRIHPFDDGNGRTARILMNFILMKFGYPPVIVRTEDKDNYYAALRQADAGIIEAFMEYITENLNRSLDLMIRGAKGEKIEDEDDLDKELAILDKKLEAIGTSNTILKTEKNVKTFYNHSVIDLIDKINTEIVKFGKYYEKFTVGIRVAGSNFDGILMTGPIAVINKLSENTQNIRVNYVFTNFSKPGIKNFDYRSKVLISFHPDYVEISSDSKENVIIKKYGAQLTKKEINDFVSTEMKTHLKLIQFKLDKKSSKK